MALNPDYVGRVFRSAGPYEVSRVKIAEFADAIGDPNPVFRDEAAARKAGHPGIIAPPTFAIVVAERAMSLLTHDPGLGLNFAMVVHGDQGFTYHRPIRAGDVLTFEATITEIKELRGLSILSARIDLATTGGEPVCSAFTSFVDRSGRAEPSGPDASISQASS